MEKLSHNMNIVKQIDTRYIFHMLYILVYVCMNVDELLQSLLFSLVKSFV